MNGWKGEAIVSSVRLMKYRYYETASKHKIFGLCSSHPLKNQWPLSLFFKLAPSVESIDRRL
jgi:hypothetical protein